MPAEQNQYLGREQSYIKHLFLREYLQAAAYKTLQARSSVFNFVDAFAGPWRVSDAEKYSDASFDQALRTLESVRSHLGRSGAAGLKIRFCFCEREGRAVEELQRYAEQNANFEIHVFGGLFENNLDRIAAACPNGFTFTFIDPTGWNVRSGPIMDFLREQKGEFLLNFMAEHVNRHAGYAGVSASFGRFLAYPDWESDFNSLPPDWSNEERVLCLLRRRMKAAGAATYLPDFPVKKPGENRIKMRLLLGTHSPKGLEVFRNVQAKAERREIELRRDTDAPFLFSPEEVVEMEQNAAGVGCPRYRHDAEEAIKGFLAGRGSAGFSSIACDVLESVPIRLTQLRGLARDMKKRGVVAFDLPPRKQVPQPDTLVSLGRRVT